MWEDPANQKGGKWSIRLTSNDVRADQLWESLLLCMIGESIDPGNEITGAVYARRGKGDRISLWTADVSHEKAIMEIGRRVKAALRLEGEPRLEYAPHETAITTGTYFNAEVKYAL